MKRLLTLLFLLSALGWGQTKINLATQAKPPGNDGQLLYNNNGSVGATDPIVSGLTAEGAAPTENPVYISGKDYGTGCSSGPCKRVPKVDSSGYLYVAVTGTPSVNATLAAETTKVIGTVRLADANATVLTFPTENSNWSASSPGILVFGLDNTSNPNKFRAIRLAADGDVMVHLQDGSGNALTSTSSALDVNVKTVASGVVSLAAETTKVIGTVNVAAGQSIGVTGTFWQSKQPVSAADGDVIVRCASAANCPVTATLAAETTKVLGTVRLLGNSGAAFDQAPGSAVPASAVQIAGTDGTNTTVPYISPCERSAKNFTPISITTATTTRIVAPAASKKTYICSLTLMTAAANNIAIVEGTGGTCGTGTAGVYGGTTAANGFNFAANGGITTGNGAFAVAATAGTNVDLCLITSAATAVAGNVTWVQYP